MSDVFCVVKLSLLTLAFEVAIHVMELGMFAVKFTFKGIPEHTETELADVTTGSGLTVTTTDKGAPEQEPAIEIGVTE